VQNYTKQRCGHKQQRPKRVVSILVQIAIDSVSVNYYRLVMDTDHLIRLADALAAHLGRAEATISNKAAGHALLFKRLREGHGCTVRTAKSVSKWFAENWPADLEWPADVPRPSIKKDAA
jgi:hypothetical protein